MEHRLNRQLEYGTYAMWVALMMLILFGTACGPKAYPTSRPKFGDSTQPVGPDKGVFKHGGPRPSPGITP